MKSNYTIFKTKNLHYLYSPSNTQILLLHPLVYHLLSLKKNGVDLDLWMKTIKNKNKIENIGIFSKKEILLQYKKIIFLSENNYFNPITSVLHKYTGDDIRYSLSNTRSITFEVTENCNLSCDYCIYGKYYIDQRTSHSKNLNINAAKKALDFILPLWDSSLNSSYDKKISIGFYGGEALLNFNFINEIVNYVKELPLFAKNQMEFSMTTNGVLLDKYISFLVENNFFLRISLDGGTEKNNSYRKFHNGNSAFEKVYKNILEIKDKYPAYFEKKVHFISVLHNHNSYSEISDFFYSTFNKKTNVSQLATDALNPELKEDFWTMYQSPEQVVENNKGKKDVLYDIENKESNLSFDDIIKFIRFFSGYVKDTYLDLIMDTEKKNYLPTGTCNPFKRMIFITAGGKILPCERIGHQYELGSINDSEVDIDFDQIANKYNNHYTNIYVKCGQCIHKLRCGQCMFHTNIGSDNFECTEFIEDSDINSTKFFSDYILTLEKTPDLYLQTTNFKLV
jgi:uncharacterized protein